MVVFVRLCVCVCWFRGGLGVFLVFIAFSLSGCKTTGFFGLDMPTLSSFPPQQKGGGDPNLFLDYLQTGSQGTRLCRDELHARDQLGDFVHQCIPHLGFPSSAI